MFCSRSTLDATKANIVTEKLDEIVAQLMTDNNIILKDELRFEDFVKIFGQYRETDAVVGGRKYSVRPISRERTKSRYHKAKSYKQKYNKYDCFIFV